MIIEIDPERPRPRDIDRVVSAVKAGELIVYPTDTCYGIGGDIFNKNTISRIYQIKNVPRKTPFSFVCHDLSDISVYARVSDFAYRVLKRYLPGPYTFILKGSKNVPKMMLTKRKTAGIRIPDQNVCLEITRALGRPVISASASIDDEIVEDPRDLASIIGKNGVIVDCGIIPPAPSSVVSLVDDVPEVIREGKGDISFFMDIS